MLGDAALIETMRVDLDALDDRHRALFRFLDRVNAQSFTITAGDAVAVRAAGWTDEELYFAITVCALFNFYNRWIDATGVHAMSDVAHRLGGKRLAATGYVAAGHGRTSAPAARVDNLSRFGFARDATTASGG